MDWKDLTSCQKICKVQLTADTQLGYINELVGKLPDPFAKDKPWGTWTGHETKLSWRLEPDYTLVIHAQKYMTQAHWSNKNDQL